MVLTVAYYYMLVAGGGGGRWEAIGEYRDGNDFLIILLHLNWMLNCLNQIGKWSS